MRELLLGVVLALAGGLIVAGVACLFGAVAFIVAGLLLAGWGWLIFGEVADESEAAA